MKPGEELLIKSKQYILDHGWTQKQMQDSFGKVCALGAITKSSANFSVREIQEAVDFLRSSLPNVKLYGDSITRFNDDYFTDKQDVLELFDQAIERARA